MQRYCCSQDQKVRNFKKGRDHDGMKQIHEQEKCMEHGTVTRYRKIIHQQISQQTMVIEFNQNPDCRSVAKQWVQRGQESLGAL